MLARPRRSETRTVERAGRSARRSWLQLAACFWLGLGVLQGPARADNPPGFHVIVHPDNPVTLVEREFLADAFLKRTSRWRSGEPIRPVDLRYDSPVRAEFSNAILKRSIAAVRSYWQQRIFSGRGVPPPEVDSEAAAVRYVQQNKGGVGYVSSNADIREVKVLAVR
jgi:hypothetical protein